MQVVQDIDDVKSIDPGPSTLGRILYVINEPGFFLSHRSNLARAAVNSGYEVHVATPQVDDWQAIERSGFTFHPVSIARWGMNGIQDMAAIISLVKLYRHVRPDVVHHVSIKPVLYGSIAARMCGVRSVVNSISGLGFIFLAPGMAARLRRSIVRFLYRIAAGHSNVRFIVQNQDDAELFVSGRLLQTDQVVLIPGSGVNGSEFAWCPIPDAEPRTVLMVSRILRDKGIREFVEAARLVRARGLPARFVVVGAHPIGNPSVIPLNEIEEWRKEGSVEFVGHQASTLDWLQNSSIVCLPSYREGLPKALLEGAAVGRPLVATDVPGCREVIEHGRNGFLVPAQDASALASSIAGLLSDSEELNRMGRESRLLFEERGFAEENVLRQILSLYKTLLLPIK